VKRAEYLLLLPRAARLDPSIEVIMLPRVGEPGTTHGRQQIELSAAPTTRRPGAKPERTTNARAK